MDALNTILDAIAVPVLAISPELGLVASNRPARTALPIVRDGENFDEFLQSTKGLKKLLCRATTVGESFRAKIDVAGRADFSVTVKRIAVDGCQELVLATFEDRTLKAGLKTMRTGFVANVSHELRSPLTAISGFVETLQGPAIEDVELRSRFLGMMAKEVGRMSSLVSDLLSLSQVEAKERQTLKNKVQPNSVIMQALESVTALAKKHDKKLRSQLAPDLPDVMGRQDDLTRLFINILENAILYSREKGDVSLTATVARASNPLGKPAIAVCVCDDGEGIAKEDIPNLTQRFYRVDKSRSRHLGGTGLGLAIVKHILVRHQGKLVIESELGKGSVFTIYLPIKE